MDIVYAVHGHTPGVARIRLWISGFDGDVLAVAADTVSPAWVAAGDLLLREDSQTAAEARNAAEAALSLHPGATAAIAAHPHGYVFSTRTKTSAVTAKPRFTPAGWNSRLRAVSGVVGARDAHFGEEGLSFGEMAGAFLLSAVLPFDAAERGQDLGGVVGGIECPHRS